MSDKSPHAFPQPVTLEQDGGRLWPGEFGEGGMSLRQWFAGQAIVGLVAEYHEGTAEMIAVQAFAVADAMLAGGVPCICIDGTDPTCLKHGGTM